MDGSINVTDEDKMSGLRSSPGDVNEPEEPPVSPEAPPDVIAPQQERIAEDSSVDVSHTYTHTTASVFTHTFSEQDSGSAPDLPISSLHHTIANNSMVAFTGSDGEDRVSLSHDDDDDNDDDDEHELIVLDPEHPLMKRFQEALKDHLTKQLMEVELKLREKVMDERAENTKHEAVAIDLYSVQQDMARQQATLEAKQEKRDKHSRVRKDGDQSLEEVSTQYNRDVEQIRTHRTRVSELQSEADRLDRHLFYMEKLASDLHSDATIMKNAKNKAQMEKEQAELQKYQQDQYVDRLTKQEDKLKEEISLLKAQIFAQSKIKQEGRDSSAEAQLELDSILLEMKQLLQQWNSAVKVMKRKDEAYNRIQEAMRSANQELHALDLEAEGWRRDITEEQEKNEALTVQVNRTELNISTYKKLLEQTNTKQEALQKLYSTHTHTLQETERSLNRVTMECSIRQAELSALRKQTEKVEYVRVELEEKIMRKMQEKLTHNSTAKHTHHLITKTMEQRREKEAHLLKVECALAGVELEVTDCTLHVEALSHLQQELEQELMNQNQQLTAKEALMDKLINTVDHNQATINTLNKKIEQIRASTGHEDVDPLEIERRSLSKLLEEIKVEKKENNHLWLIQQEELVKLNQEKEAERSAILELNTKLTVLQQRNIRTKNDTEQKERVLVELEVQSKALRLDIQKLTSLLNQNTRLKQEMEQDNSLMENTFIHTLRDAERESVETQLHLEKLQEEKERLLNTLVEAERQIMLWERKIQLARETRSAVDLEVGKGDINNMKLEIHRMEAFYNQLMKDRERMLRVMDTAVVRLENTEIRGEAQTQSKSKHITHTNLQNTMQSLQRYIILKHKEEEEHNNVIKQLQQEQISVSECVRESQAQITELKDVNATVTDELNNMQQTRDRMQIQLLHLQSMVKQLQALKEGRYRATVAGEEELKLAMQTEREQLLLIRDVLQQIVKDSVQFMALVYHVLLLFSEHTKESVEMT